MDVATLLSRTAVRVNAGRLSGISDMEQTSTSIQLLLPQGCLITFSLLPVSRSALFEVSTFGTSGHDLGIVAGPSS
jgi:hypothetical protein